MVQTRHRVRSLPSSTSSQQELSGNGRSKSLISLNWCNSSPSTVDSASFSSLNDGADIPDFTTEKAEKGQCARVRSSSSSSSSGGNPKKPNSSAPGQSVYHADSPNENSPERPADLAKPLDVTQPEHELARVDDDDVFRGSSEDEELRNGEPTQLSVIDEERDDIESTTRLETLDEESDEMSKLSLEAVTVAFKECDENHEDDEIFDRDFSVTIRQRPSAPALLHSRGQSMSSLDIPHSYSQPETLSAAGDTAQQEASIVSTAQMPCGTQISKLPVRRGLSSSSFMSAGRDPDAVSRPISQICDALGEGTILVALSSSSTSMASKSLDRSLSISTPSIDSMVNELARANGRGISTASRKAAKHPRTPSIVVPAITPRIPLMGLLPTTKASKSVDRAGDGTKTKERSSFFGTRSSRRSKLTESRPHFWIKNSCSNSACCDVCNKPLANTDAYQCNDCLSSVHASCKASLDKSACVKMKHPKPAKSNVGPLRPTILDAAVGPGGFKQNADIPTPFNETVRSQSMKSQRHSVIVPDIIHHQAHSMTAPAGLNNLQPSFRTYANGFRSYIDMEEEWKALGLWDEFPDAWSTGPGKGEKKKLPLKEVKRQDNFHEMFITEQHHCQTLSVLRYTYFLGLVTNGIVPYDRLTQLLPCLDELLDVHYQFFRALKKKRENALVVSSVHDVLMDQFSSDIAVKMIKAYTNFCFQKDATVREYNRLITSSGDFSNFIKTVTAGSFYKSRSLPDCLLLVTQRLSKYHSFVENLRKNTADESPEKEGMIIAERAVKELIASVDSGIERAQMQQARMEICNSIDQKAATELSVQDVSQGKTTEWKEFFKVDDLRSPDRTLLYYGDVLWQNARQKPAEITLLLFSDVIVFLQKNGGGGYNFFRQDQKNGVIRLHKLIVRDKAGRLGSQGIYLIAVSPKPDMYDISCKSKKELSVWMDRIQRAVQACSSKSANDNRQSHSLLTGKEEEELAAFFGRLTQTNFYMRAIHDERMKVYADIFGYIAKLPLRNNEDKEKIAAIISGHKSNKADLGDQENAATIWQAMQERFGSAPSDTIETPETEDALEIEDKEATGAGVELGRSKTFHFVANSGKRPKLRKHPTVAGIPEIEERLGKRHTGPQLLDDLSEIGGRSASEATLYLLNCWANFAMQIEELRQDKERLSAELALAKERSRQTAGALACDSGLENLRRLSTELETRRKQFYQETSDKDIELNCREKALKEREEKVSKEEAEIQSRWARLTAAWENQRLHGLPLPPLVSSPSSASTYTSDAGSPVYYAPNSSGDTMATDSSPVAPPAVQRAPSLRPMDMAVPPQLAGAVTNASRTEIRQQLPTNLSKDHVFDSLSKKWRASKSEKTGGKKYFASSKSPDRQMIPNKLAINKK